MMNAREQRLQRELERMLALRRPNSLMTFSCAPLSEEEGEAFLKPTVDGRLIGKYIGNWLSPEQYLRQYPGQAPEKYLIQYTCKGLMKTEDKRIVETEEHMFEVIFGWDYPVIPPRFVWLTPIWHPNIDPPYLCTTGRPFAVGTTLDQIILMVGQMIQYRIYNLASPLRAQGQAAADWASLNKDKLPVDRRDLLDGQIREYPLVTLVDNALFEWADAPMGEIGDDGLVEVL